MIARLWICTEQPLVLTVLALPLSPLLLLLLLSVAAVLKLGRHFELAALALRLATVAAVILVGVTGLFLGMALALEATGLDPDVVLRLAPIGWAVGGALVWLAVGIQLRSMGWTQLAQQLSLRSEDRRERRVWLWSGVLLGSSFLAIVTAARPSVNNQSLVSWPYRLLEWGVIDEINLAVSNECLAMRVLEYGDSGAGREAQDELAARDASAVDGVAAKLDELRDHWPPPAQTTTSLGITRLLRFLDRRGETRVVGRWQGTNYQRELTGKEPVGVFMIGPIQ